MAHDVSHLMSAQCVARDLHTIAPGPLERTCWRRFVALSGDCNKSQTAPFNAITTTPNTTSTDRLVGLVVKASASRAEDPGSNPSCDGIFPGSSHASDLNIDTPVATLPGAWRYRVSAWPGVSML